MVSCKLIRKTYPLKWIKSFSILAFGVLLLATQQLTSAFLQSIMNQNSDNVYYKDRGNNRFLIKDYGKKESWKLIKSLPFQKSYMGFRGSNSVKLYSIVSPFDNTNKDNDDDTNNAKSESNTEEDYLELTFDNVEMVLDEMRPYLMSDGGNVQIADIDGPIVKLELMGNCGTCPSSTMTMKMGLEKRLKEKIPEIEQVVQAVPEGPELTEMGVDSVLDGVRPFLTVAGGSISVVSITGIGSVQPKVLLRMEGSNSSLYSVKLEITQRVLRHFMVPGLRVEFEDD